jgi:hypothetical protein
VAQLLDDYRAARKAQIEDVREASGFEALYRQSTSLDDQAADLQDKIRETPASSLSALLWQLELARDYIDHETLLDTIIAGVKLLAGPDFRGFELEELMKAERKPRAPELAPLVRAAVVAKPEEVQS